MVIIERKTFKVRRKTNYGTILWLIVIVSCVIGFLVAANYSDELHLKESEGKGTEEGQSRNGRKSKKSRTGGKTANKTERPTKKDNQEEINSKGSGDNVEESQETIFDADEEVFEEEVGSGLGETSEKSGEKSQDDERETIGDEIKNEEGGENVNTEIEDGEFIEGLKTKISTNAPKQYQQIERSVNSLKDSIKDWDKGKLEKQKNLFTNTKEKLKVKLQEQNVQNDEQWSSQIEEQILEMGLKIKEIENKLSELPND